jgi:hypothetical protein
MLAVPKVRDCDLLPNKGDVSERSIALFAFLTKMCEVLLQGIEIAN